MNSSVAITILAGLSIFGVGCATPRPAVQSYNPMPQIWAKNEERIVQLKKAQTTEAQWTKDSDAAAPISTIAQLRAAVAATGAPADAVDREREQKHLERIFRTSHHVIHFGFEGDAHEMVFFDSRGRQLYAHP